LHGRLGHSKGRLRRVLTVALARKLLIALWRFATDGVVPDGAVRKTA
jgi:transposase